MKQAIILAGGFGTRLQPVVSGLPKPMAPINGKPFLEILLNRMNNNGFTHVILSVGYMKEKITSYFGSKYKNILINYVTEGEPLGTGGAIKKSLYLTDNNYPCFIFNGDSFLELEFRHIFETHNKIMPIITMSTYLMQDASRYGIVEINNASKVISFAEKQSKLSGYINAGVYLVNPKLLLEKFTKKIFSFEEFLNQNINNLNIYAYKTNKLFIDIGIPEDYKRAQDILAHY